MDQAPAPAMTRAERALIAAQANREAEEASRLKRNREREERIALDAAAKAAMPDKAPRGAGEGGPSEPRIAPDAPDCPDPASPDAPRLLYAAFYRRMWNLAHAPLTDRDTTGAYNATRLGASIGKTAEPAKDHRVDMGELMGGTTGEDDVAR